MFECDKLLGRLVVLALLSYFSWRIFQSGQKLFDDKIGLSVSWPFSKYRLFPSLSICMSLKNVNRESLLKDIDGTLQRTLDDVLSYVVHRNGSKPV